VGGKVPGGACGNEAVDSLILSMGLVWVEVHILAQRATTPSKKFLILITAHVLNIVIRGEF
jgi:hypothetical protein